MVLDVEDEVKLSAKDCAELFNGAVGGWGDPRENHYKASIR
jgi:hypothetical protein